MAISVLSAAKHMGLHSQWSLSNLALQKLIYICQMLHLGQHGLEKPLVYGSFEAWDYGPVHPNLYQQAKVYGADPVRNIFRNIEDVKADSSKAGLMDRIVDSLGNDTSRLVAITHWKHGAWAKNYQPGIRGIVIPNEDILEEYNKRLADATKQNKRDTAN